MKHYRGYIITWLVGMISGFTLMISSSTLNFWLSIEKVDIRIIGLFALVSLPYAINFLWAPIMDTIRIPHLTDKFGNRIAWVIVMQLLLSVMVYWISAIDPKRDIYFFAIIAAFIALIASATDSVLGAFRAEAFDAKRQGALSGTYIFGYRIGMLLSGYVAIYLNYYVDFNTIYKLFSILILILPLMLIIVVLPDIQSLQHNTASDLSDNLSLANTVSTNPIIKTIKAIISPIGSPYFIIMMLIFLITYRLADNFITIMIHPFVIKIGYNAIEIANAGKLAGILAAIIGGLIASHIMKKRDIFSSLLIFGIIHAFAHLLFLLQEFHGKNIYLLFLIVSIEASTGGMTMAAYIALITSLCRGKFKATQYAFFSSMMGLSRSILPAISGYFVAKIGWPFFFISSSIIAIPALILLWYIKKLPDSQRLIQ